MNQVAGNDALLNLVFACPSSATTKFEPQFHKMLTKLEKLPIDVYKVFTKRDEVVAELNKGVTDVVVFFDRLDGDERIGIGTVRKWSSQYEDVKFIMLLSSRDESVNAKVAKLFADGYYNIVFTKDMGKGELSKIIGKERTEEEAYRYYDIETIYGEGNIPDDIKAALEPIVLKYNGVAKFEDGLDDMPGDEIYEEESVVESDDSELNDGAVFSSGEDDEPEGYVFGAGDDTDYDADADDDAEILEDEDVGISSDESLQGDAEAEADADDDTAGFGESSSSEEEFDESAGHEVLDVVAIKDYDNTYPDSFLDMNEFARMLQEIMLDGDIPTTVNPEAEADMITSVDESVMSRPESYEVAAVPFYGRITDVSADGYVLLLQVEEMGTNIDFFVNGASVLPSKECTVYIPSEMLTGDSIASTYMSADDFIPEIIPCDGRIIHVAGKHTLSVQLLHTALIRERKVLPGTKVSALISTR